MLPSSFVLRASLLRACLELLPACQRDAHAAEVGFDVRIEHEAAIAVAKRGRRGDGELSSALSMPQCTISSFTPLGRASNAER